MVNLRIAPFYLDEADIQWVEETKAGMTVEEKIGQLFIMLDRTKNREEERHIIQDFHIGGCRYENEPSDRIYEQNKFYQECAKIPLLIAFNGESGGNGACSDGTYVASGAACEAAGDETTAEHVGYVGGREAKAIGCNWNFGPVCDIRRNWRNTVINTRAEGADPETVLRNTEAYIRGMRKSGMAVTAKHFPGDGEEELDQHLVMGTNNLSCEEWDQTYGKVYRTLIEKDEIEAVMAGHICLPAYERKFQPDIQDEEILPATLSYNLITRLLREQLGFNGLVVTDASHMGGMTAAAPRKVQVPGAIAAGCDMFLFFNDVEEDFSYMLEGYWSGVISEERLNDAVTRILGLKAHLGLHKKQQEGILVPQKDLSCVGCKEHQEMAEKAAKDSITLVKDTLHQLPISPKTHPRAYVIVVSNPPETRKNKADPVRKMIEEELADYGYDVTMHQSYYDLVAESGFTEENMLRSVLIPGREEFKKKYDVVFTFLNLTGYAQKNNMRVEWSVKHSTEIPWYVREVPTVITSLNYTNHLIDVPMAKTFINAYAPTRDVIRHLLKKLAGDEMFTGRVSEDAFCGRWDTRV